LWFWSQVSTSEEDSRAGAYRFGFFVSSPAAASVLIFFGVFLAAVNGTPSVFAALG